MSSIIDDLKSNAIDWGATPEYIKEIDNIDSLLERATNLLERAIPLSIINTAGWHQERDLLLVDIKAARFPPPDAPTPKPPIKRADDHRDTPTC